MQNYMPREFPKNAIYCSKCNSIHSPNKPCYKKSRRTKKMERLKESRSVFDRSVRLEIMARDLIYRNRGFQ